MSAAMHRGNVRIKKRPHLKQNSMNKIIKNTFGKIMSGDLDVLHDSFLSNPLFLSIGCDSFSSKWTDDDSDMVLFRYVINSFPVIGNVVSLGKYISFGA